uniref:Uncharacterized protein n=1 Tax=Arundo donax TaxID=35708 RepID=A0A0A8YIX2_ARUDO
MSAIVRFIQCQCTYSPCCVDSES